MTTSVRAPRLRLLALGALLATGAGLAALAGGPSRRALEDAFVGSGILGAVAFALLYAVLALALVPGSVLTIAAGAIYGPVVGTLVAITGALAGATAAFALARRTAAESVQQIQSDRVGRVQRRLRDHGLPAIIALRLIPLVPFNVLNYMAGASAVSARDYVVGTAIGIVPGAIAFATLGATAHDPRSPAFIAAAALAVALIVAGTLIARRRPSAPAARSRSRAPAARASLAPELRRLAWSAAFVLTVAGALLASGLYH